MCCSACGLPIIDQHWFRCTCGSDVQIRCFACICADANHLGHTFVCVTPTTPAGRKIKICSTCTTRIYDRCFRCQDLAAPLCKDCLAIHVAALHSQLNLPTVLTEDVGSGKISPTVIDIAWPDAANQPRWELLTRDEERTFLQTIDLVTKKYRELEEKYRTVRIVLDELLEETGMYEFVEGRNI